MKSTLFPIDLSWEVGREIENPNIPLTMYLDNPNCPNTKSIPFIIPIDVDIPSHQHKTHCIPKNMTSFPPQQIEFS
jgi:hypothetical protein